jgi:hypothetical protein
VKSSDGKVFKVPLDNPTSLTQVEISQPVNGDGMIFHPNGNLIVVARPDVLSLSSNDDWASATVEGISPNHELATTAAIRGEDVYVVYAHLEELDESVEEFEIVRVKFEEKPDFTNVFFMPLASGLNMISLPLKPINPYTARAFAEELDSTVVIKLDETRQRFVGFTLDAPDAGFDIEGGKGYIINVPEDKVVAFTGAAWTNQPPVEAAPNLAQNDSAWAFVVSGGFMDEAKDGYCVTVRNTRTNDVATDIVQSEYFAAVFADLNRHNVVQTGDGLEVQVKNRAGEVVSDILSYTVTAEHIRKAFLPITLKSVSKPISSMLLQNYPNPFNPETWIPFKLAQNASVTIRIYDTKGQVIRTISLGNRPSGIYVTKSKAGYWDGTDSLGQKVSSGVYYYTLQAGEFRTTRKMVVVK